jgi:hypothetical protein
MWCRERPACRRAGGVAGRPLAAAADRNVEELQNPDGRYIVTFDGSIDGNLIQIAILVTENAARKVESIRPFARPWPVVKLFRQRSQGNAHSTDLVQAAKASMFGCWG